MKSFRTIRLYLVVAVCLGSLACTGQLFRNYGKITPDEEATRQFESYYVNPDFRYYITGSVAQPNAIMGINRNYHIDAASTWKEADMTPELMKEYVESMQRIANQMLKYQHGFTITDDNGKPIGVWYSILEARTFVHMQENGTVRIDTPPLDIYRESGDHDRREMRESR
jgi:hypothetical protein